MAPEPSLVDELVALPLEDGEALGRLQVLLAPPPAYTFVTLATALKVPPKAVSNAVRRGELPATKRCGRWLIAPDDLEAWVASRARSRRRVDERVRRPMFDALGGDNGASAA